MSVSLPVIVGAGVVIVALVCIGLTARRRRRADAAAAPAEPVEAVFVDDMPGELQSFMAPATPLSQAAAAHAHVYPVHKLQEVAEAPITFGPPRHDPVDEPVAEPEAPKLEAVPDPEPEVESQIEPQIEVAPAIAGVPDNASPAEQEPTVEAAPVTESVPSPEVALLTAQIEVLADTIARLTDRLDAVASAVTIAPAPASVPTPAEALEPARAPDPEIELAPEPVMLRSVAYEPDAEVALESELEGNVEPRVEPAPFARKRVDDDLLSWPSDDDLDRFSSRQARRDI